VFALLKQKLEQKKRLVNEYGRHKLIAFKSPFVALLQTWNMSINAHKTPVECFEYTVASQHHTPLSRPL